jgi:hypothetical protein
MRKLAIAGAVLAVLALANTARAEKVKLSLEGVH